MRIASSHDNAQSAVNKRYSYVKEICCNKAELVYAFHTTILEMVVVVQHEKVKLVHVNNAD
jgi:hypothetical protein